MSIFYWFLLLLYRWYSSLYMVACIVIWWLPLSQYCFIAITLWSLVFFDSVMSGRPVQFLALYVWHPGLAADHPISCASLTTCRPLLFVQVSQGVSKVLMSPMIKALQFLLNVCIRSDISVCFVAHLLGDIYAIVTPCPLSAF